MRSRTSLLIAGLLLAATACSSSTGTTAARSPSPPASPAASPQPSASPAAPYRAWVCRPGGPDAACTAGLDATVVRPGGAESRAPFVAAKDPAVDCFYVYPTVSKAQADNAPRVASPEVVSTVRAQAALFGSVCRVFAPVYRQVTLRALSSLRFFDPQVQGIAYADVLAAWRDYLAHDNGGRPVVLIGHSQGAMMLTRLIQSQIDGVPAVRAHLLSAILLGGNITVRAGGDKGGSFANIPACRRAGQTGCVIAYSSFATTPPTNALFGRTSNSGQQVLCTDPATLAGGSRLLHPYVPADRVSSGPRALPGTAFVAYQGELQGACRTAAGATFLKVAAVGGAVLPQLQQSLGSAWGLHTGDVTLALGDLVQAVRLQAARAPKG